MAHIINYKPIEEGKRYHVYADLLWGQNNKWCFSFEKEYDCHGFVTIYADLTKEEDIKVLKEYLNAYGIKTNEVWMRISLDENYRCIESLKRIYGGWKSFKYLNTLTF